MHLKASNPNRPVRESRQFHRSLIFCMGTRGTLLPSGHSRPISFPASTDIMEMSLRTTLSLLASLDLCSDTSGPAMPKSGSNVGTPSSSSRASASSSTSGSRTVQSEEGSTRDGGGDTTLSGGDREGGGGGDGGPGGSKQRRFPKHRATVSCANCRKRKIRLVVEVFRIAIGCADLTD